MRIERKYRTWVNGLRTTAVSRKEDDSPHQVGPSTSDIFAAELSKAKVFRKQHRHNDALKCFRRALLAEPQHPQTWIDYGYTAIACQNSSEAHAAFLNALEFDPSNLAALEMVIDIGARAGVSNPELRRHIVKAGRAIEGRSHRHLDFLDFLIPFKVTSGDVAILGGSNAKAKALLTLHRDGQTGSEYSGDLTDADHNEVLTRFNILRGRWTEAEKLLARSTPENIPVNTLRRVARRQANSGNFTNVLKATRFLLRANPDDTWASGKFAAAELEYRRSGVAEEKRRLLEGGFPIPASSSRHTVSSSTSVLYLLHNSLPYSSAGYATRSHGLISNIRSHGIDIAGVTRPGYPFDRPEAKHDGEPISTVDFIDGTPYFRLSTHQERLTKSPLTPYVYEYADRVETLARERKVGIIHAASNHWNGLAAVLSANRLGIPSVYEVRGLWEITRISRQPEWNGSLDYQFMARMEADAARAATHVLTITSALRQELIDRGVDGSKIDVVPNGVDSSRFVPREPDEQLKDRLGLTGKTIIGYVGSILDYEGIDVLIDATRLLKSGASNFHVLIVGDGDYFDTARARVEAVGLQDSITFTGRVPHEDVEKYYSIIDIAPIPRHSLPVTEMVSPLKPFEAMAMGKVVVGSDVAAIDEILIDGVNGLTFAKDSPAALAESLGMLTENPGLVRDIGFSAREWVVKERDWKHVAQRVVDVYRTLEN